MDGGEAKLRLMAAPANDHTGVVAFEMLLKYRLKRWSVCVPNAKAGS